MTTAAVSDVLKPSTISKRVEELTGRTVKRLKITDNSVLVRVGFGRIGTSKKVSPADVEITTTDGSLKISKKLLDSPEMDALTRYDAIIRQYVYSRTNKPGTFGHGMHFLGVKLVEEFEAQMRAFQVQRLTLVEKLCARYVEIVNNDRERLKVTTGDGQKVSVFRDADYPSVEQVRNAFELSWQYLSLIPPRSLEAVNETLYKQAQDQLSRDIKEATDAVQLALRTEMASLVEWGISRLKPGEDGKKRIFRSKSKNGKEIGFTAKIKDFLAVFEGRDITDDTELQAVVQKARALMEGVDPEELRKSEPLRESLRKGFEEIKNTLDPWIIDEPIRDIEVPEE